MTQEFVLIGMENTSNGYTATCCQFGDEKDGNTSFKAPLRLENTDSEPYLFQYLSECWNESKRIATVEFDGLTESGKPINPRMVSFHES